MAQGVSGWRPGVGDIRFVPVMLEATEPPAPVPGGRVEIVAGSSRRVIVGADVDPAAVVRLLLALEQA